MILHPQRRTYCFIAIVFTVLLLFLASCSLLSKRPRPGKFRSIEQLTVWQNSKTIEISPLHPEPWQTDLRLNECTKRLGTPFLRNVSNASVNYCSEASSSKLACFHTHIASGRTDSFCIGTPAVFDQQNKKLRLSCVLRELSREQVAAGVPTLAQFPSYWYDTGPRSILQQHVRLDPAETVEVQDTDSPDEFIILVRREAPIDNLFHHLMQIFSIYLTLDALQLSINPTTGGLWFRTEDIKNTRVIIFDDHEEGPFYDQWTVFAERPMMRIGDLQSHPIPGSVKIIPPLSGSANPLWQDDWDPQYCGDQNLLRVFSSRMLDFYGISNELDRPKGQLVLTFIDRTEKRSLINKQAYINDLKVIHPAVQINLVNFASLFFVEQLQAVRKTDILVGVHGAGLTHGIFLPPASTMVEIMPFDFNPKTFRNLAQILGHQYFTAQAEEPDNHTLNKGWQYDDVFIEQDRFNDLIHTAIQSKTRMI